MPKWSEERVCKRVSRVASAWRGTQLLLITRVPAPGNDAVVKYSTTKYDNEINRKHTYPL